MMRSISRSPKRSSGPPYIFCTTLHSIAAVFLWGISFSTALAIAVLWAIIHGFFSWLYVIYYLSFK